MGERETKHGTNAHYACRPMLVVGNGWEGGDFDDGGNSGVVADMLGDGTGAVADVGIGTFGEDCGLRKFRGCNGGTCGGRLELFTWEASLL